MLNQSFSADNFRKILDLENRKGVYLEGHFFPSINKITENIKQCNKNIREKRRNKPRLHDELKNLYEKRKELKEKKEEQLNAELQKVTDKIVVSTFKVAIDKKDIPNGKSLYIVRNSPEYYFTMKQLQSNLSRLFNVKQANRSEIVSQVKVLLNDGFPKYVIRTDIDDFYENIPQEPLIKKIKGNNLMTPFSRKILIHILNKYKELSGSDKGIPRGIGISAYLAELYMRDIDKDLMSLKGISYYARYVDDIIIIFTPISTGQSRGYLDEVKEVVAKFKLNLNDTKTCSFDLQSNKQMYRLDYLGYEISFGKGILKTKLTEKRITKYKNRIDSAFDHYLNLCNINEKEARKLLVKRIRFLTGNTRLKNNKENILVGIYYSNCQLTEKEDLISLDDYLRTKINNTIKLDRLQERLKKYNFKEGFEAKRVSPFKTHELKKIMEIWN